VCPVTAPTFPRRYIVSVHNKPKRFYGAGHLHFITCSCFQRRPLLDTEERRDLYLTVLEEVRKHYRFVAVGYVVMPEHIHLLIGEPEERIHRL
jgi:putative transposase